ncbi:MAG: hypothetical protein HeimC3_33680 [Candidatus Heimdallarchaeota archaeon LC_3]|nr:MAG: hypothetical protein HeimC3_33680 [Candidatus Heimdallarchaeota archaeon LC_3]
MMNTQSDFLDFLIDDSLPSEEREVLIDFIYQFKFPLPKIDTPFPQFGYVVQNGHITQLGLKKSL